MSKMDNTGRARNEMVTAFSGTLDPNGTLLYLMPDFQYDWALVRVS